jgi:putative sterol carrier protein
MTDIGEVLTDLADRFNKKARDDEKLKEELKDVTRTIVIEFRDGDSYKIMLQNAQLIDLDKGSFDTPDIRVITDTETFEGLITRTVGPMRALATGRLKLVASLEDKLRFRKLL